MNSFFAGDDTTGRLISKPFTIERNFIRFLIGGGVRSTTQLRLVMGGKTVRAISGRDNERLEPAFWDVSEFRGQPAHIEIVDDQKGPWGHINVDQIAFSDRIGDHASLELLEHLLPFASGTLLPAVLADAGGGAPWTWPGGKTATGPRRAPLDCCPSFAVPWARGKSYWPSGRSSNRITRV